MADPTPEEIKSFLDTVASLLSQPVQTVDFDDLFARPGSDDPEAVADLSPDDIEVALLMAMQRAEIAERELAEQTRVAAQWEVLEAAQTRHDDPPEAPDPQALQILDPTKRADMPALAQACATTLTALADARGDTDEVFEKATEAAFNALDARDEGIGQDRRAIEDERNRRKEEIGRVEREYKGIVDGIHPDALKLRDEKPTPAIKRMGNQATEVDKALLELKRIETTEPVAGFDNAVEALDQRLDTLGKQVGNVNTYVETLQKTARADRAKTIGRVPPLTKADMEILAGNGLLKQRSEAAQSFETLYKGLDSVVKSGTPEEFESAFGQAKAAFELATAAHERAVDAALEERSRRSGIAGQLNKARVDLAKPEALLSGTDESKAYDDAAQTASTLCDTLTKLTKSGPAGPFGEAETKARDAVDTLRDVLEKSIQAASKRKEGTDKTKKTFVEVMTRTSKSIISELSACLVPGIGTEVEAAFSIEARKLAKLIRGRDAESDETQLKALQTLADQVQALDDALNTIDPALFALVGGNVEIRTRIAELRKLLETPGIGPTALEKVTTLKADMDKVRERYDRIAMLQVQIQGITDKTVAPEAQKVVKSYPDLRKEKDELLKGQLTERTNKMVTAIRAIEEAIQKKAESQASQEALQQYQASDAYQLLQLCNGPSGPVIDKLTVLVGANRVSIGAIAEAYRSSWDNPDRFSVEVPMKVDTYGNDFVIHAHCATDGTPLPGNACHVKRYLYRYDPGGYAVPGTCRATLLPARTACLAKATSSKLV